MAEMTTKDFDTHLEFSNEGRLSLFFIGAGSAFQKSFYQTNLLVVKGGTHFLIDCGTLCPYALEKEYGTKVTEIKNVILTHPHADHIGGVEELALSAYYLSKSKLNIAIPKKYKRLLWNQSLRGGIQYSETGKMTFEDYFSELPVKKIQRNPFEMYEFSSENLNVKLFRTRHVTTRANSMRNSQFSFGMLFDDRILFTGDTQFNPGQLIFLLEKYKNIEYIFHDCDVSGFSSGVHAPYAMLKTLPDEIRSKMYLCHYNEKMADVSPEKDGFIGFVKRGTYYIF